MGDELGYLRDYGHWILSGVLIFYGLLVSYLCTIYEIDHE
jgi:hypothetical protein